MISSRNYTAYKTDGTSVCALGKKERKSFKFREQADEEGQAVAQRAIWDLEYQGSNSTVSTPSTLS